MAVERRKKECERNTSDELDQIDQANCLIWAIAVQPNQMTENVGERERKKRDSKNNRNSTVIACCLRGLMRKIISGNWCNSVAPKKSD